MVIAPSFFLLFFFSVCRCPQYYVAVGGAGKKTRAALLAPSFSSFPCWSNRPHSLSSALPLLVCIMATTRSSWARLLGCMYTRPHYYGGGLTTKRGTNWPTQQDGPSLSLLISSNAHRLKSNSFQQKSTFSVGSGGRGGGTQQQSR